MKVNAELIIAQGAALQGIRVAPERAAELAAEVGRINGAVAAAAGRLGFDDDPIAFRRIMNDLKAG